MSKREIISHCFRIWCSLHSVPCDQTDIYSRGGHWYGQTRKVEANGYDTTLLSEWRLQYDPPQFTATKIKDYT